MFNFLKRVTVLSFLVSALAFNANAQSSFSVGLGLNMTDADHNTQVVTEAGGGALTNRPVSSASDDGLGISLNLKYKKSLDEFLPIEKLYVAPSIFFETLEVDTLDSSTAALGAGVTSRAGAIYSVNSRSGIKFDLGYKVIDNLDAYVSLGVATVDYELNFADVANITNPNSINGRNSSEIIGFGVNYSISNDLAVNFEYNKQQLALDAVIGDGNGETIHLSSGTKIESMQLGVAHKF